MLFEIRHLSEFTYSRAVFVEPLLIRLQPRCDAAQITTDFSIQVDPAPDGISACVDLDGTTSHALWFAGSHERLVITTSSLVHTLRANPFDFVVQREAGAVALISYPGQLAASLVCYLEREVIAPEVDSLAREIAADAADEPLAFLTALVTRIPALCTNIHREEGAPWSPALTLSRGEGSCRDVAVLFMDACRSQGFATRFVSGYNGWDAPDAERELHAWAEVYLPGAGWRGFDASSGLAVDDHYVALASAATPINAAPTSGSFRGDGAISSLFNHISIRMLAAG